MLIPNITLTKEDILAYITEEEIFTKYTDFNEIGKKFYSPFGKENTPSCIVFPSSNYLYFKDFSSGKHGNCFSLVQQMEGIGYREALLKIKKDFNLKIDFNRSNLTDRIYVPKVTRIQIKQIYWTTKHINYWKDYGISMTTLKHFNIVPISHYWINDNRFNVDFGFAYYFYDGKFKILQPEEDEWKWISNTNPDTIQGYWQLNKPTELIVTSSLKDVACIYENLGLQAIAPNSENVMLPISIIDKLKTINTTIWFNNDEPGIKAAEKYREYGFNIFVHDLELPKDPSDLFKEGYDLEIIYNDK